MSIVSVLNRLRRIIGHQQQDPPFQQGMRLTSA
jgi:hypothetical protein